MNKQETGRLISLMRISYPASFSKLTPEEMRERVLVWSDLFRDYPFEPVQQALKEYILTNDTGFAPSPGQLNTIIAKALIRQTSEYTLDKYSAWDLVVKTITSSDFHYEPNKTFNKLPESVKRAIGSVSELRKWSTQESGLDYVRKNFEDRYAYFQEAEAEQMRLPEVASRKLMELPEDELLKLTENIGRDRY